MKAKRQLLGVAHAGDRLRLLLGPGQRGQQQGRENGDDGNDDQQFDQRKAAPDAAR